MSSRCHPTPIEASTGILTLFSLNVPQKIGDWAATQDKNKHSWQPWCKISNRSLQEPHLTCRRMKQSPTAIATALPTNCKATQSHLTASPVCLKHDNPLPSKTVMVFIEVYHTYSSETNWTLLPARRHFFGIRLQTVIPSFPGIAQSKTHTQKVRKLWTAMCCIAVHFDAGCWICFVCAGCFEQKAVQQTS